MTANDRQPPPRIFGSPLRYIQGPEVLSQIGGQVALYGKNAALVSDQFVLDLIGERVIASCRDAHVQCNVMRFNGEVTPTEVRRLVGQIGDTKPEVMIAAGGGKGIDIGKALAKAVGAEVITLPTAASNDAPTSKIFVLYDENHRLLSVEHLQHNPVATIVDTALLANAPKKMLLAGIGDALTKKFEVECCISAGGLNIFGGNGTHTARILADHCYSMVRRHAIPAIQSLAKGGENSSPGEDFELLIEATVLLSGLCFENGGLSISHALTRGLSATPGVANALHGLQVAYGLVVQLTLEKRGEEFMEDLCAFYNELGLPKTLKELGLTATLGSEILETIVAPTMAAPHTKNFPRILTAHEMKEAILQVEAKYQ